MRLGAPSVFAAPSAALASLLVWCACSTPAAPPLAPPTAAAPIEPRPAEPRAFEENGGAACAAPALPPLEQLPAQPSLPDPFLSASGQRITTRADWTCRRAEIAAQVQEYELGPKPPKPSVVTGALQGDQLTITAGEPGHTVSFSVGIERPAATHTTPTTPTTPTSNGSVPALIVIGRSSLSPVFAGRGVAVITFDNNAMGAQGNKQEGDVYTNTRGQGTFYELYGKEHPASSMMAWAWGVSRVIDALAATPEAGIDVNHIAVSGCSRHGKGALVVGAFDERIALTVPQESGAGGTASWRISQAQMDNYRVTVDPNPPGGKGVQTLLQASGEQPWFRASFAQFGKSTHDVSRLPFDQHMVLGLVAPRALFVLDNTDMQWLGDDSSFTDAVAASEIWAGLGARGAMGASQAGGHPHCKDVSQPQLDELGAYIDNFLLGVSDTDTDVLHSDRITPDRARWITWSTPALK